MSYSESGEILYEEFEKLLSPKNQTRQYRSCIQFIGAINSGPKNSSNSHTRVGQKFC